ncbi:XRE family transcriptional regulator [Staphylococcus nepalensis]|uniref:XRE family transcriptional regulator n=1 Tax=Staphylococcus nepalensis TaxID=214473 RepID=UPI001A990667|nr:XRE family transcriptional regulator [Staphylococcus nepalensis]MBO1217489.1 XRE family transcriptional regulator [Staphylococcus nepalensis]MBO1237253.1 XRE family transcriptional regulator [Staphylococcus nepalensis]
MKSLFNLRKKYKLEINELTNILNKKYGTSYEIHQLWEWENDKKQPKMKDALILADFFGSSYVIFLESKMKKVRKQINDVNINK